MGDEATGLGGGGEDVAALKRKLSSGPESGPASAPRRLSATDIDVANLLARSRVLTPEYVVADPDPASVGDSVVIFDVDGRDRTIVIRPPRT